MSWLLSGVLLGIALLFSVWILLAIMDWFGNSKSGQRVFTILFGIVACVVVTLIGLALFIGFRAISR